MKNLTKIFMAVAVSLFAFSCVQDATEDLGVNIKGQGIKELTLSLEESRTHLGEKVVNEDGTSLYPLYWSEGDAISVNGVVSLPLAGVAADATDATFQFTQEVSRPLCVVYPAAAVATVEEGEAVEPEAPVVAYPVNFLATQPYTVGTFAPQAAPMYGYAAALAEGEEETPLQLQHLTGVLRLAIKGNGEKVTSIKVKAEKGAIAGAFTVDCTTGVLTPAEGASNTVTVTFAEPLVLGAEAAPVYLTVPAGDHGTYAITISTEAHAKMTVKFSSAAKPVNAGSVREFSAFEYAANTNDDEDVFIIDSEEALVAFAKIAPTFYPRTKAVVKANIDMSKIENWTPIASFGEFEFDGGSEEGYTITNVTAPLFEITAASIKNVKMTNVNMVITDLAHSGAIACDLYGNMTNCSATGTIEINNTTFAPESVRGKYDDINHAALVGLAHGASVSNCTSDVDITITSLCEAEQSIKAAVGGVVGGAIFTTQGCSFDGLTNNGDIVYQCTTQKANLYISGVVAKDGDGGGVDIAVIKNCTNNGNITSTKESKVNDILLAGITGVIDAGPTVLCENLTNNGALTHNGTAVSFRAAGIATYWAHATAKNWHNTATGDITITTGAVVSESCYISGLVSGDLKTNGMTNCDNSGNLTIGDNITFNGYVRFSGIADTVTSEITPEITCWNNGALSIGYCNDSNTDKNKGRLYMTGLINTLNSGALKNCQNKAGGTITANVNTWQKELMIGGLVAYQGNTSIEDQVVSLTDCENFAAIKISAVKAGGSYVGGVSGQSYADPDKNPNYIVKLVRTHNSGTITLGGTTPGTSNLGGLIGHINTPHTEIEACENKEAATITYNASGDSTCHIGGLVGQNGAKMDTTITDSFNKATVKNDCIACTFNIAGIVGVHTSTTVSGAQNALTISNTTNSGDVLCKSGLTGNATKTGRASVAGILGSSSSYNVTISNCHNTATVEYGTVGIADRVDIGGIYGRSANTGNKVIGCTNNGLVTFKGAKNAGKELCLGGIMGTPQATTLIQNCKNLENGTVSFEGDCGGAADIGGIAGGPSGGSVELEYCYNYATVKQINSNSSRVMIGGVIGYAYSIGRLEKCGNHGNVFATKTSSSYICAGGLLGYSKTTGTNNLVIKDCYNAHPLVFEAKPATNYKVGGLIGLCDLKDDKVTMQNLYNLADLTYKGGSGGADNVGGIIGQGNSTLENCQCYGTITAIGFEGKVGMIMGIDRIDTAKAINCKAGGKLLWRSDYEADEETGENTLVEAPGDINADNWYKYLYKTEITKAVAQGDGCDWLPTKPSVPVYTPAN